MPFSEAFFYVILGIFTLVLGIQIFWKKISAKIVKPVFWIAAALVLVYIVYISYLQYQAFKEGPLGLTLGSLEGLKWFFGYARLHFWNEYLISFVAALGIFAFAKYINKKRGEIFFEKEEIYLGGLGTFLVGYPGFFFYIILVLIFSSLISFLFLPRGERLPLYYFWMPTAIVVLLVIHFWAENQGWWASFRF